MVKSILGLSTDQRANLGLFLAFQYPVSISGVTLANFLRVAVNSKLKAADPDSKGISLVAFRKAMKAKMDFLGMDYSFAGRYLNEGFSGGEKKRAEILQLAMLEPKFAILDETDSGLDIDAVRIVSEGVNSLVGDNLGVLVITHYQRMLNFLKPDFVHIMYQGRIVETGQAELALKLEENGYDWIREVYGADVVTSVHPVTGRTFILPISTPERTVVPDEKQDVLVISGGGSGSDLMHFLSRRGYSLTAGILATTDTDCLAAKALQVPCEEVPPFSAIPEHSLARLRDSIGRADRIILSVHPVGTGNLPVLAVLRGADPAKVIVYLPEGRGLSSYDFTRGAASAVIGELCDAGARCTGTFDGILGLLSAQPAAPRSHRSPER